MLGAWSHNFFISTLFFVLNLSLISCFWLFFCPKFSLGVEGNCWNLLCWGFWWCQPPPDGAQLIPLDKFQLRPQELKRILELLISRLWTAASRNSVWPVPLKSQRDANIVPFKDSFASGTSPKTKSKLSFQSPFFFYETAWHWHFFGSVGIHHHFQFILRRSTPLVPQLDLEEEEINHCYCTT